MDAMSNCDDEPAYQNHRHYFTEVDQDEKNWSKVFKELSGYLNPNEKFVIYPDGTVERHETKLVKTKHGGWIRWDKQNSSI